MKIVDVICSPGRTGFYFDDQRAIKRGAGHDGVFYTGEPVTEGFTAVLKAGESISVMMVLEDGQIAAGSWRRIVFPSLTSTSSPNWWGRKPMTSAACAL